MAQTAAIEFAAWNNSMVKKIRKTFAITTLIMGSATRALRNISGLFDGVDPIIVGVGAGIA